MEKSRIFKGAMTLEPPNASRISRAAPIDRDDFQAKTTRQKRSDLVAAKRRRAACACWADSLATILHIEKGA